VSVPRSSVAILTPAVAPHMPRGRESSEFCNDSVGPPGILAFSPPFSIGTLIPAALGAAAEVFTHPCVQTSKEKSFMNAKQQKVVQRFNQVQVFLDANPAVIDPSSWERFTAKYRERSLGDKAAARRMVAADFASYWSYFETYEHVLSEGPAPTKDPGVQASREPTVYSLDEVRQFERLIRTTSTNGSLVLSRDTPDALGSARAMAAAEGGLVWDAFAALLRGGDPQGQKVMAVIDNLGNSDIKIIGEVTDYERGPSFDADNSRASTSGLAAEFRAMHRRVKVDGQVGDQISAAGYIAPWRKSIASIMSPLLGPRFSATERELRSRLRWQAGAELERVRATMAPLRTLSADAIAEAEARLGPVPPLEEVPLFVGGRPTSVPTGGGERLIPDDEYLPVVAIGTQQPKVNQARDSIRAGDLRSGDHIAEWLFLVATIWGAIRLMTAAHDLIPSVLENDSARAEAAFRAVHHAWAQSLAATWAGYLDSPEGRGQPG